MHTPIFRWAAVFAVGTILAAGCASSSSSDRETSESSESASAGEESDSKSDDEKAESASAKSEPDEEDTSDDEPEVDTDELPLRAVDVVAKIDGEPVSAATFNEAVADAMSSRKIPEGMVERYRKRVLKGVIGKALVERKLDRSGIEASKSEVDEELERFRDRFPNEEASRAFMKQRKMSIDEVRNKLRKDVKLRKLLRQREDIDVSEEDAKQYYNNNSDEFSEPEQVKARHILIKTSSDAGDEKVEKARKRAEKLAERARSGETSFAKLAEKHSEGPSAKKGGDLGYFPHDRMVEAFSDRAFSIETGEISDPVKTRFGYHVIKRTGHKPANQKSFEEVRDEIVDKLQRRQLKRAVKDLQDELRDGAEIVKFPDHIEVVDDNIRSQPPPGMPKKKKKPLKNLPKKPKKLKKSE